MSSADVDLRAVKSTRGRNWHGGKLSKATFVSEVAGPMRSSTATIARLESGFTSPSGPTRERFARTAETIIHVPLRSTGHEPDIPATHHSTMPNSGPRPATQEMGRRRPTPLATEVHSAQALQRSIHRDTKGTETISVDAGGEGIVVHLGELAEGHDRGEQGSLQRRVAAELDRLAAWGEHRADQVGATGELDRALLALGIPQDPIRRNAAGLDAGSWRQLEVVLDADDRDRRRIAFGQVEVTT